MTHLGNPLSTLDDMKGAVPEPEEDDEEGAYEVSDARVVAAAHFGGGSEGDRRSKKEVMAEVMAVSKAARAEKRMQKEEDEDLLDAVDDRFQKLLDVRPAPCARLSVEMGSAQDGIAVMDCDQTTDALTWPQNCGTFNPFGNSRTITLMYPQPSLKLSSGEGGCVDNSSGWSFVSLLNEPN